MPFQYETFDDGQPLIAREIQKTSNNQFELYETYKERGRGLIAHKILVPAGSNSSGTTTVSNVDSIKLLSVKGKVYPDRYYLVEGQVGRAKANGGFGFNALFIYLKINGVYVSVMNGVNDWSTTLNSTGFYLNHIWQSPETISADGELATFALWADEAVDAATYDIQYASGTYQGRVRLSVIDIGSVYKGNYYG